MLQHVCEAKRNKFLKVRTHMIFLLSLPNLRPWTRKAATWTNSWSRKPRKSGALFPAEPWLYRLKTALYHHPILIKPLQSKTSLPWIPCSMSWTQQPCLNAFQCCDITSVHSPLFPHFVAPYLNPDHLLHLTTYNWEYRRGCPWRRLR